MSEIQRYTAECFGFCDRRSVMTESDQGKYMLVADHETDKQAALDEKDRQMAELTAERDQLQNQIQSMDALLSARDGQIAGLADDLAQAKERVGKLEDVLRQLKVRIAFIGWPREPMYKGGPDWRKEIAFIEKTLAPQPPAESLPQFEDIIGLLPDQPAEEPKKPKIITLCGSSKFVAHMAVLAWEMEKLGAIVFSLHLMPTGYPCGADHLAETEGVAAQMDELHLRKIDMSDEIFVVNVGGYIGDSTRREIAYATAQGKPVKYLEPPAEGKEGDHKP